MPLFKHSFFPLHFIYVCQPPCYSFYGNHSLKTNIFLLTIAYKGIDLPLAPMVYGFFQTLPMPNNNVSTSQLSS